MTDALALAPEPLETEDELTPSVVLEQVKAHDTRMDHLRTRMGAVKAAYCTRFWEWVHNSSDELGDYRLFSSDVELNKIAPAVWTHQDALFPKRSKLEVGSSAMTTGDPEKMGLLLNGAMMTDEQRERWSSLLVMGLTMPMCGMKVKYEAGTKPAHQRVKMRVFPAWECLVDDKVHDKGEARFWGHVYWERKAVIEDRYPDIKGKLTGGPRTDFLKRQSSSTSTASTTSRANTHNDTAPSDINAFVRVVELCNMVDEYEDPKTGERFKGRLEVHLMDQGGKLAKEPVFVGPLPLWEPDGGDWLPHIHIHMFESEPEYPLRGLAPAWIWLPQQLEINATLSKRSAKVATDTVRNVGFESVLGSEGATKWQSMKDNELHLLDDEAGAKIGFDARKAVATIAANPGLSDVDQHLVMAERHLQSNAAVSPAALSITQDVTAREIDAQVDYTDSRFGRLRSALDMTMARASLLWARAIVAAMLTSSASAGGFEDTVEEVDFVERPDQDVVDPDELLAERYGDDEAPAKNEDDEDTEQEDEDEDDLVGPDGKVDDGFGFMHELREAATPTADDDGLLEAPEGDGARDMAEVIVLQNARKERVEITIEDIDSEFTYGFSEEGRSPRTYAEIQTNLKNLLEPYKVEFLTAVAKRGTPEGILAEASMRAMWSHFTLPEQLDPDRLLSQLAQAEEEAAEEGGDTPPAGEPAPADAPPAGPPPPGAEVAPPPGAPPAGPPGSEAEQFLAQLQAMPPDQALQVIAQQFGNDPGVAQLLEQVMQLPPESRAEGVQALIGTIAKAMQPMAA